jgi:acyl carrier protein
MLEKLIAIIEERLNVEGTEVTVDSNFKEDLKADSLDLFELVMALEEEFGIEIPSEKLESFTTVGSVVDYMKENGIEI